MKYTIILVLSIFTLSGLFAQKKSTYFNHTQVSLLIGEESDDKVQKSIIPSFHTVNGVRNENVGIGLGFGADPFEYMTYPVFLAGYYFVNNLKNNPYFVFKIGHAFSNSDKKSLYGQNYKHEGGLMVHPEIGVRFKMSTFDMTLSGGYRFQRLKSSYDQYTNPSYSYNKEVEYNRITLALGIMF
jgi:hypothetical protein